MRPQQVEVVGLLRTLGRCPHVFVLHPMTVQIDACNWQF